jgi:Ti-type conjugative transfer relaxase TraA
MIPRCVIGRGVTGAVNYVLGEGRDPETGELAELAPNQKSRVDWISGTGFGFPIESKEDADLARRIMEFDAINQSSRTRQCEKDCVHIAIGWRPGQNPTRAEMEEAAMGALKSLGMENAKAIFAAHGDESYAHLHIVASKINPATGRAYDLRGNYIALSKWAQEYEQAHGGVICVRRADANRLRDAIAARDAGAVLACMTEQRATFTADDLNRALAKQIRNLDARTAFAGEILIHSEIVSLADQPNGPITRYSTKTVLAAEHAVLQAASTLAEDRTHDVGDRTCNAVLARSDFATIRPEQAQAFRSATGPGGLALIDGQAGTGKSYTISAIRQAYEAAGCNVIGLAPTNAVALDMGRDGFKRAGTIHSEIFALNNKRASWDRRTIIIMDEAAMVDTKMMALVTGRAREGGAKLILVGDDRQLSSIERGGMFGALKERHGASALTEVTRQRKDDDRRAAGMMSEGNFHDALAMYEAKGAIHWTRNQDQARAILVKRWAADTETEPEKTRFVFAYTNIDVAQLNADLRSVRRARGELGPDFIVPTADGDQTFARGDRLQLTGTNKSAGLYNGMIGTVEEIKGTEITVKLDGRLAQVRTFDAEQFPNFRHGYAGTIYRGQGRTLDQSYLYHSEHWRSAASYVALTRHRDKAELFVATNTARDIRQLARQMARVDDRRAASHFFAVDQESGAKGSQETGAMTLAPGGPTSAPTSKISEAELPSPSYQPLAATATILQNGPHVDEPSPVRPLKQEFIRAERSSFQWQFAPTTPFRQEKMTDPGTDKAKLRATQDQIEKKQREETQRNDQVVSTEHRARRQADDQVRQLDELRTQKDNLLAFEAAQKRHADEARIEDERRRASESRAKQAEGDIHDAGDRYRKALGDHYDMRDPYGSLARAAMAEFASFTREREQLNQQIAKERDLETRRTLETCRDIEAADYMAVTSRRIADQSVVITGRRDSEEATRFRDRAAEYEAESRRLREAHREQVQQRDRAGRPSDSAIQERERVGRQPPSQYQEQPSRSLYNAAQDVTAARSASNGELSEEKAARIARIQERGREFESEQKNPAKGLDRGGRTR